MSWVSNFDKSERLIFDSVEFVFCLYGGMKDNTVFFLRIEFEFIGEMVDEILEDGFCVIELEEGFFGRWGDELEEY